LLIEQQVSDQKAAQGKKESHGRPPTIKDSSIVEVWKTCGRLIHRYMTEKHQKRRVKPEAIEPGKVSLRRFANWLLNPGALSVDGS
jgi:hypothetical protein